MATARRRRAGQNFRPVMPQPSDMSRLTIGPGQKKRPIHPPTSSWSGQIYNSRSGASPPHLQSPPVVRGRPRCRSALSSDAAPPGGRKKAVPSTSCLCVSSSLPPPWLQHRRVRVPAPSPAAVIARRTPVATLPHSSVVVVRHCYLAVLCLKLLQKRFVAFLDAVCSFLQLRGGRPPATPYPVESFSKLVVAFFVAGHSNFQYWLQLQRMSVEAPLLS